MYPGLAVWLLLQAYVVWRVATVPAVARRVRWWIVALAVAVLWLALLVSRLVARGSPTAGAALEATGMTWLGVLFLLFLALLAADVVTVFGLLFRRHAPRIRGWAVLAALALSGLALVQGLRPPAVTDYEVRLGGLPRALDGTTVVAISDLHLGTLLGARWLRARIAQVEALHPDLVIALGDIVEGHGGIERAVAPALRNLTAPLGVYAVAGNHEHYGRAGANDDPLAQAGFRVLHDEWAEVRPGLVLAGVDDLTSRRHAGRDSGAVARALANRPAGAAILLSHTPWQAEDAARAGAGLMLSAHTHGGQIWPLTYLSRLSYPLNAGRYVVAGMPVIVSRGTGTWGPRMRLWRRGEILRITLRAA